MDLMKGKGIQHKTKGEENKTLSTPCRQICKHTHICIEQKLEGNVLYCSFAAFGMWKNYFCLYAQQYFSSSVQFVKSNDFTIKIFLKEAKGDPTFYICPLVTK